MVQSWKFMMKFCDEEFIKALQKRGFENPSKVQLETIPQLMTNKDVKVIATTGSGKTLAFVIPTILLIKQKVKILKKKSIYALVLSPTRELAQQTYRVFLDLVCNELSVCLMLGGDQKRKCVQNYRENGGHIFVSTPGVLADLLTKNSEEEMSDLLASSFKYIEILVIDESDKLLEMGFMNQTSLILSFVPRLRRTGLFSASESTQVDNLGSKILRNPFYINVSDSKNMAKTFESYDNSSHLPSSLENYYKICSWDAKFSYLCYFIDKNKNSKIIIFFATNFMVDYFSALIIKLCNIPKLLTTHGKVKNRLLVYDQFKKSKKCVLMCSDLISRGIDFCDVDWVVQFEPSKISSTFVHRCGRTARMGKTGKSLILLYPHEIDYISFIHLNQNIKIDQILDSENLKLSERIKKFSIKDRNIYIKGLKAFTSYINFYTQHECKNIFNLKEMDVGGVANDFGLLHIPQMQEIEGLNIKEFIKTEIDHSKIKFKDKKREKMRAKIYKNKLNK